MLNEIFGLKKPNVPIKDMNNELWMEFKRNHNTLIYNYVTAKQLYMRTSQQNEMHMRAS